MLNLCFLWRWMWWVVEKNICKKMNRKIICLKEFFIFIYFIFCHWNCHSLFRYHFAYDKPMVLHFVKCYLKFFVGLCLTIKQHSLLILTDFETLNTSGDDFCLGAFWFFFSCLYPCQNVPTICEYEHPTCLRIAVLRNDYFLIYF